MKKMLFILFFMFFIVFLFSNTITVKQDGTGDYVQIQTAVDNANPNDTIRVYPGIYYENIVIRKDLSLVSNYEYTNEDSFIRNTIIDGNHTGSCVLFQGAENDSIRNYICGFTIQHGSGSNVFGNTVEGGYWGGGIYTRYSVITIKKNIIKNNRAYRGGGVYFYSSNIINLIGNKIVNNSSFDIGGAIFIIHSDIKFDDNQKNNIFLNYSGMVNEIFSYNTIFSNNTIVVDTFTVFQPDFYFIKIDSSEDFVPNSITYDIQHAKIEQIDADLYVSPDGDDANSGLTEDEPLKTIAYALSKIKADSLNPHTIHIANGVYSPSLNGQYFPLHMKSYVSLIGESMENTVLDGDGFSLGIIYGGDIIENGYLIKDYTVKNFKMIHDYYRPVIYVYKQDKPHFENIIATDNTDVDFNIFEFLYKNASINIKNIYIENNEVTVCIYVDRIVKRSRFENVKIKDNLPSYYYNDPDLVGGLALLLSNNFMGDEGKTLDVVNCQITGNVNQSTYDLYPAVALQATETIKLNFVNNTVSDNHSVLGAAITLDYFSYVNIYNSILYDEELREIVVNSIYNLYPVTLNIYNSLVQGGYDDILILGDNNVYYDEATNLDEDPMFVGNGDYPFALSSQSPCIDAGTLDLPEGVELPERDLAGNPRIVGASVDMGAYEYQGASSQDNNVQSPKITMLSIYPNPFSLSKRGTKSSVKIKLELSQGGRIELSVYNLKGQKVKRLIDAQTGIGTFNTQWDLKNNEGKTVSAGLYFVKLTENGKVTRISRITVIK